MSDLKKLLKSEVFDNLSVHQNFSLKIGVLHKNKPQKFSFGKSYSRYDLASMTKAIFTASSFIHLYPELINKKVSQILPWMNESQIKVKDLLSHSSGIVGHIKIYEKIKSIEASFEKRAILKKILRDEFKKASSKNKSKKVIYSDIGFFILAEVLETYTLKPLEEIWNDLKISLKYPKGFDFKTNKKITAPTEKCLWRKKTIQGEVFDRNASTLGGVNPHTGLFGSIDDMLQFGKFIRADYKKHNTYYKKLSDGWAYGFMMPSGNSTAGKYFSKKSIGHLGYTGVSFWYDPVKDLYVSILSNRTYPDREDFSFNKFRPVIHDIIYKNLVE